MTLKIVLFTKKQYNFYGSNRVFFLVLVAKFLRFEFLCSKTKNKL